VAGTDNIEVDAVVPLKLHYEEPKIYGLGTKYSAVVSDFKCGSDGTIFFQMVEDYSQAKNEQDEFGQAIPAHVMLMTGLTPSGDVIRFAYEGIPGLRDFLPEARYFVSNSRIYTLESAAVYDPSNPGKILGQVHVIKIYNYKGIFQGFIRLDTGIEPINIAAFDSGDVLVVSEDKWNQTARLLIFDSGGKSQSELRLFDEDYGAKLQLTGKGISGLPSSGDGKALSAMLALAHWAPLGDDLLFASDRARLPVLEINEHGLVRATALALPTGEYVGALLPPDLTTLRVLAGQLSYRDAAGGSVQESSANALTFFKGNEIEEFNRLDGSLIRRIEFREGLIPVCGDGDTYTFLTSRKEDGRIQLIRGNVIH